MANSTQRELTLKLSKVDQYIRKSERRIGRHEREIEKIRSSRQKEWGELSRSIRELRARVKIGV